MSEFIACKNCKDRKPGCHSTCNKYIQAKMDHDERERARKDRKSIDDDHARYLQDMMQKERS